MSSEKRIKVKQVEDFFSKAIDRLEKETSNDNTNWDINLGEIKQRENRANFFRIYEKAIADAENLTDKFYLYKELRSFTFRPDINQKPSLQSNYFFKQRE